MRSRQGETSPSLRLEQRRRRELVKSKIRRAIARTLKNAPPGDKWASYQVQQAGPHGQVEHPGRAVGGIGIRINYLTVHRSSAFRLTPLTRPCLTIHGARATAANVLVMAPMPRCAKQRPNSPFVFTPGVMAELVRRSGKGWTGMDRYQGDEQNRPFSRSCPKNRSSQVAG
jgi:hypothetical protein